MSSAPPYDHIVLISVDTLRSDCLRANPFPLWPGTYPDLSWPGAPALDELAALGAYFPNTVAAAPYTSASHASILTGRWPTHHGVYEFFRQGLRAQTVFSRAKRAGYATTLKVDFPVILGGALGFDKDVDHYLIEEDEAALQLVTAEPRTLSCVHFGGVHIPYGFHSLRFGGEDYRETVRALEKELPLEDELPVDRLTETFRDTEDADLLVRYKRIVSHLYRQGEYSRLFGMYLEGVTRFGRCRLGPFLERLLAALDGRRWLLVLFGDHGEEYDEDSYGHFNTLAEGVLRVPVVIAGTDIAPCVRPARVRGIDIGATVLEAIGDRDYARRRVDGASLFGAVRGEPAGEEPVAYGQAYIPETQAHVEFQRSLLKGGRNDGTLPHFLFQEAVYHQDWKFTRRNFEYGPHGSFGPIRPAARPARRLERIRGSLVEACAEPAVEAELAALLDAYNRDRRE